MSKPETATAAAARKSTAVEWVFIFRGPKGRGVVLPMAAMADKVNAGLFENIDLSSVFPYGFAWATEDDTMFVVPREFVSQENPTPVSGEEAAKMAEVTPAIENFIAKSEEKA